MAVKSLLKCCIKWNSWLVKNNSLTARVVLSAMGYCRQSAWFEIAQRRERQSQNTQIHPLDMSEMKGKEYTGAVCHRHDSPSSFHSWLCPACSTQTPHSFTPKQSVCKQSVTPKQMYIKVFWIHDIESSFLFLQALRAKTSRSSSHSFWESELLFTLKQRQKKRERLLTLVLPLVIILLPVVSGRWQINCLQKGIFSGAPRHQADIAAT